MRKCFVCGTTMTLVQRRQCASCLHIVHDNCSKHSKSLPGREAEGALRVCDECDKR